LDKTFERRFWVEPFPNRRVLIGGWDWKISQIAAITLYIGVLSRAVSKGPRWDLFKRIYRESKRIHRLGKAEEP